MNRQPEFFTQLMQVKNKWQLILDERYSSSGVDAYHAATDIFWSFNVLNAYR
jgi:hypothetical protein